MGRVREMRSIPRQDRTPACFNRRRRKRLRQLPAARLAAPAVPFEQSLGPVLDGLDRAGSEGREPIPTFEGDPDSRA